MEYSTLPEATERPIAEPGMEVAPDSGLQVVESSLAHKDYGSPEGLAYAQPYPHQNYGQEGYYVGSSPGGFSPQQASAVVDTPPPRSRRKFVILGAILLVLVIIGAVLGGVLGSRAAHSSDASADSAASSTVSSSTLPSSTASIPTATPTSIGKNSPLAAVSFRTTSDGSPAGPVTGSVIVLGFKGPEGMMKASIFDSAWGILPGENSSWQATPQDVTTSNVAENGTGLAMAGFATATLGNNTTPQYSLELMVLFVNKTGYINGLKYIDTAASAGTQPQSINDHSYSVRTGSRVAAYWPWFVFQDWSGFINVVKSLADPPYSSTQLQTVGIQGTKLTIVPISTNYSKILDGSYGIFYQMVNGQLAALVPGKDTGGSGDITQSWPSTSTFPKILMPGQASFSAFSFARSSDKDSDLVSTFVLYQDESSQIKQVWTDDSKNWHTSSPAALATADNGTDISCLTPAASNDTYSQPLYVAPQSNLTRCYYQRGGWVVEVQLNGTDWEELGKVPMP